MLSPEEERGVLDLIPTEPNIDPLYDRGYHESKIKYAQSFNPELSRTEAWAISMYLGPKTYCQGINRMLLGAPMEDGERDKYQLISKAAQSALSKIPDLTPEGIRELPQPDDRLPPAEYLKRFVHYPDEVLDKYQAGKKITEPNFLSTTYWQAPVGQVKQYAEQANAVFHIHTKAAQSWGKYVDLIKRKAREGEVLFPPETTFEVNERSDQDYPIDVEGDETRPMTVIDVQEVDAQTDNTPKPDTPKPDTPKPNRKRRERNANENEL